MSRLEQVIAHGNRGHHHGHDPDSLIRCADGFEVSVIAGGGTYCQPRPEHCICFYDPARAPMYVLLPFEVAHDYPGPYSHVEVGYPSIKPEPWADWVEYAEDWGDGPDGIYANVPVALVRDLIASHGGEVEP